MKKKYYDGPGGVFYDNRHDEIFTLELSGNYIVAVGPPFRVLGKKYNFRDSKRRIKDVALEGWDEQIIRLGDL